MSLVISYTNHHAASYSYLHKYKNTSYSYSYTAACNLVVWGHAACDPGDLMQIDPQVMLFAVVSLNVRQHQWLYMCFLK